MSNGADVFHFFPELAEIGRKQLQAYCDEWQQRPIARQHGVSLINVDDDLGVSFNLNPARVGHVSERVVLPIDELLVYIVERHFADPDERRRLFRTIRDTKHRWDELGQDYGASMNRQGRLHLTCKNPDCRAELETGQDGVEGWTVTVPPTDLMCPLCGVTATYYGSDLHLLPQA